MIIIFLFIACYSSTEGDGIKQQIVWVDEDKILLESETIEHYVAFYKKAMASKYLDDLPKTLVKIDKRWRDMIVPLNRISDSLRNMSSSWKLEGLEWKKYEQLTKEINSIQSEIHGRMMGTNLYAKYEVRKIIDSIYPAYSRTANDLIAKRQSYIDRLRLTRFYISPYLSSPEKTFKRLQDMAIANDTDKCAECLYIVNILEEQGYASEMIPIIQDSLALWLEKPGFSNLKEWLGKSLLIFKQCDFVLIHESAVDDTTRELLMRAIPNVPTSIFRQNISKYYFNKQKGKWLFNFRIVPVTMGIKVVNKVSITDIWPVLVFRDVDSDGLLEIVKGVTRRESGSHLDEILYEYYIMKFDTLQRYFYDWQHYPAHSDTEYMNYNAYSFTGILDMRDFMTRFDSKDDKEKLSSYIPLKYDICDLNYSDIDMDSDTDVILNIGQVHNEKNSNSWISNNIILFLENKSGRYEEWFVDTLTDVSYPGAIEIKDIDEDGQTEILCWGFSRSDYSYGKNPQSIYLNIYRYTEINGNEQK